MLDGRMLGASQVEYKPFGKSPLKRLRRCATRLLRRRTKSSHRGGISTCIREFELKDIILLFLVYFQYDTNVLRTVTRGLAADQPGHDQEKLLVAPRHLPGIEALPGRATCPALKPLNPHSLQAPCYMCYMCYILHAKPRNPHSPPAPCYIYYMCYIILHARKSVVYVLYKAI